MLVARDRLEGGLPPGPGRGLVVHIHEARSLQFAASATCAYEPDERALLTEAGRQP